MAITFTNHGLMGRTEMLLGGRIQDMIRRDKIRPGEVCLDSDTGVVG